MTKALEVFEQKMDAHLKGTYSKPDPTAAVYDLIKVVRELNDEVAELKKKLS